MYEVKYCSDLGELQKFIKKINQGYYEIIGFTQTVGFGYTIIYKVRKD